MYRKLSYHCFLDTKGYSDFCRTNNVYPLPLDTYFMGVPHSPNASTALATPNPFLHPEFQAYTCQLYLGAMKRYNLFRRFLVYVSRKRKKSMCSDDLSLCPLSAFSAKTLYDVFDRGIKYTFKVSDLLSIIHSSLTHSHEFICDPKPVKNPYTGNAFSKETLYRFYVHVNSSTFAVPVLFSLFVHVDFDVKLFLLKYEPMVRDVVIKAVVDNFTTETKLAEVRNMLENMTVYDVSIQLNVPIIDPYSLTTATLRTMFPLLHHYFIYLFSLNPYYRQAAQTTVLRCLFKMQTNINTAIS
jgi:hypothetical protein